MRAQNEIVFLYHVASCDEWFWFETVQHLIKWLIIWQRPQGNLMASSLVNESDSLNNQLNDLIDFKTHNIITEIFTY